MTFRYVNIIRLGAVFQIRKQNSTWMMTFRYVNKIGLWDDFLIRKHNSTWRGLLDT